MPKSTPLIVYIDLGRIVAPGPTASIIGVRRGGEPENEAEHFMECRACGQAFDMRDLGEVCYHEEAGHRPKQRN